jgi:hypothetical protein
LAVKVIARDAGPPDTKMEPELGDAVNPTSALTEKEYVPLSSVNKTCEVLEEWAVPSSVTVQVEWFGSPVSVKFTG